MRCGVTKDSYSTVRSLTFVLPSGTTIDTAAPGAAERFAAAEPELAAGLEAIRDEIRADAELERAHPPQVRDQEHDRLPALRLPRRRRAAGDLPPPRWSAPRARSPSSPRRSSRPCRCRPRTTTAWIHFPGIDEAIAPVRDLVDAGATAVELMVAPALITAAWNMVGAPEEWKELPPESAVLLVEFGADDDAELDALRRRGRARSSPRTRRSARSTSPATPEEIELAWRVREGLHGLIGRLRLPGTALIVEDVCVPPERIAEGARDLQALLGEHGFLPGVAGHASAGNLHFMLTPDFAKQEDLERYEAFMAKLVELIVGKYDGSLKAEHGTGINMAPYVEREWGEKATELMWRVKRLADPDGVLAPGVVLNRDPGVHLRNLKTTPPIEESATTCVECGFCEPVCPSRNLTTTPRQRIVLRREMARQPAGSPVQRALLEEYEYDGAGDLRRRRLLPARLPGRDRHRRAGQGAARRRSTRERAERAALRDGEALGRRSRAPRAPACGSAGRWRAGRSAAGLPPLPRRAPRPDEAATSPASPLPPTRRRRRLRPLLHNRIFGRLAPVRGAGRGLARGPGCRSGFPTTWPAAAAGCPGARRASATAHRAQGERDGRAALGAGAGRGRCRS